MQEVGQASRDGWDIQSTSLRTILGREPLPRGQDTQSGISLHRPMQLCGYLLVSIFSRPPPLLPTARTLTAVDSLDARVISKFPLSPSSAGTRMKTSVTFWKTSQCYKMNTASKILVPQRPGIKAEQSVESGDRAEKQDQHE